MDRANEEMTTEIAIVDEATIRDKIYEVRGFKVMIYAHRRRVANLAITKCYSKLGW